MLEELYPVFKETLRLAQEAERLNKIVKKEANFGLKTNMLDYLNYIQQQTPVYLQSEEADAKLRNYLLEQKEETVEILINIMYLGRDKEFKHIKNPEKRFEAYRRTAIYSSKEGNVSCMVEKSPLVTYLKEGFSELNIIL